MYFPTPRLLAALCLPLAACSALFDVDRDRLRADGSTRPIPDATMPFPDADGPDSCSGDACGGASLDRCPGQAVRLTSAAVSLSTSLMDASPDYQTQCSPAVTRDLVFALPIQADVELLIDATDSPTPVMLSASTRCGDDAFNEACSGRGAPSRLWIHNIGPDVADTLYVLVQARDEDADPNGLVELTFHTAPAKADDCSSPLDISGGGTVLGFLPAAQSAETDLEGSCSVAGAGRQQGVLRIDQFGGQAFLSAQSSSFKPELYGRSLCGSDFTELFCQAPSGNAAQFRYSVSPLVGRFNVIIDGGEPRQPYQLRYVAQ